MTATSLTSPTRRSFRRRAPLVFTLLATFASPLVLPGEAAAKDCGGAVPCECGDRVVASVTLPQSLNNCEGDGLIVAAGVLDCDGRQIAGPGDRTDAVGVLVRGFTGSGATGAEVRNCRVRNFGRGIEIDSGTGNLLENNVVFDNEIGVWLGDGTTGNVVTRNHVRDNRDEGIHVGAGASGNEFGWNSIVKNKRENLYLINAHGNHVHDNTIADSDQPGILLKHSDDNVFVRNVVADRNVFVRGDSSGNVFEDNELSSSYYRFGAIEESGAWSYPHDNQVTGGIVLKASTCVELEGAYDTTVTDLEIDTCRPYEQKEIGDLIPYGNTVTVIRIDIGDPRYNGRRRTGSLRSSNSAPDRYRIDSRGLAPQTEIHPDTEDLRCALIAYEGVVFEFELPAGSLVPRRRGFRFVDPRGSIDGLRRLEFREAAGGTWRITMTGRVDMPTVEFPVMTLSCLLGDDLFEFTDYWSEHSRGWNLRVQP